jgi:phosphoribosylaminoimidazole-succinocarboxamide synthase
MTKGELIYNGKSKSIYKIEGEQHHVIQTFKDDVTAFNGEKHEEIPNKGYFCNQISASIFRYLEAKGIKTHFVLPYSGYEMIVKKLEMIPIEVVVRNVAAGSLTRRLGLERGKKIVFVATGSDPNTHIQEVPIVEYYYKNDELGDPLINDNHILTFGLADQSTLYSINHLARHINTFLKEYFKNINLILVDFKLEFGKDKKSDIILADDINPEGCRLWDMDTNVSYDKDLFRTGDGDFGLALEEVYKKINFSSIP